MAIVPIVVKAGDEPPVALLLQILVPPVADEMVTAANPASLKQQRKAIDRSKVMPLKRTLLQ
jgi:hypothetical protein